MNHFRENIAHIELPEKFTYPFAYEPHPLAKQAVKEVQEQLPLDEHEPGGKMYGVLVVRNKQNELGYLVAFSGQEAAVDVPFAFVPPVYDRLQPDDFFKQGERELSRKNAEIKTIEEGDAYRNAVEELEKAETDSETEIKDRKAQNKRAKALRKVQREQAEKQNDAETLTHLDHESIRDHYELRQLKLGWQDKIVSLKKHIASFGIDKLKKERRRMSAALQQQLFDQYKLLNRKGEPKALCDLFPELPPAGAGDCAAPKLLQYAFAHQLTPITMAEFWWGKSPKAELRKHLHYYPACSGKCKPILAHMLDGIPMDDDPALAYSSDNKSIDILYEDDAIAVIHKPEGLLSVPAKHHKDSVLTRMQERYPEVKGPVVAHRLDWHTSGIMIVVKSEEVYKKVQEQFANRTVKKQYTAVLQGVVKEKKGTIRLPLMVDLNNRPRQKVCFEHGKPAITHWKVISEEEGRTRIHFTPVTGRTHQLRVHAAHPGGLNAPIVGDLLYGKKGDRLHLHAESISFEHPFTGKQMNFSVPAGF